MPLPKKWIAGAIKKPGALHKELGIAQDKPIPTGKLRSEKARLSKKAEGEKKLSASELRRLKRVNLALTLRGPKVGRRIKGK